MTAEQIATLVILIFILLFAVWAYKQSTKKDDTPETTNDANRK